MKIVFPRYDQISWEGKENIKISKEANLTFHWKAIVSMMEDFSILYCAHLMHIYRSSLLIFQYGDQYTTLTANFYRNKFNKEKIIILKIFLRKNYQHCFQIKLNLQQEIWFKVQFFDCKQPKVACFCAKVSNKQQSCFSTSKSQYYETFLRKKETSWTATSKFPSLQNSVKLLGDTATCLVSTT